MPSRAAPVRHRGAHVHSEASCFVHHVQVTVKPGELLYIPAFTIHQVSAVDATISVNVFFGNRGERAYLDKIMRSVVPHARTAPHSSIVSLSTSTSTRCPTLRMSTQAANARRFQLVAAERG